MVCAPIDFKTANPPPASRYTLIAVEPVGTPQFRTTWWGLPVPLRAKVIVALLDDVLVIDNCPVNEPVAGGSNVNVMSAVSPGLSVNGRLMGDIEKPVPFTATEFTVTAAPPLEVKVTVCVVAVFTTTAPNEMLLAFAVSKAVAAFSWSETDRVVDPVCAVSVADCALLTAATVAVNVALLAAAGTRMELGTVTALLLLTSDTFTPPVGADPDKVTVHASARDPVIDVLLHDSPLSVGVTADPAPLRLTDVVGAVLEMVNCPATVAVDVGEN